MGEVISRKAAREKIMDDVKTTRTNAAARAAGPNGAKWAAGSRLDGVVALWDATNAKLTVARTTLAPLLATVATHNHKCDDLIKLQADMIWNELGRPANDPIYELHFPGGTSFYTDGDDDEQPELMLLLADLLESGLHPNLMDTAPKVTAIREAANDFGAAIDATRKPAAQVRLFDRMLTAVARAAQLELTKLKRFWRSEGLSEADVHAVIPDRPRSYGVASGDGTAPNRTTTPAPNSTPTTPPNTPANPPADPPT